MKSSQGTADNSKVVLAGGDAALFGVVSRSLASAGWSGYCLLQVRPAGYRPDGQVALLILDLDTCGDLSLIRLVSETVPVIVVATGGRPRLARVVREHGAAALLAKPVDPTGLVEALGNLPPQGAARKRSVGHAEAAHRVAARLGKPAFRTVGNA